MPRILTLDLMVDGSQQLEAVIGDKDQGEEKLVIRKIGLEEEL